MARKFKKRFKRNLIWIVLLLLAITVAVFLKPDKPKQLDEAVISETDQADADLYGPYDVIRIVDGDTFVVHIDTSYVRIRVLGIDCPESVAPEETGKANTPEGDIASARTKELLDGQKVYLEYDSERYDQYGRTLAYVYLEDGTMLEEILINEGLCRVVSYKPNTLYTRYFCSLQDTAKANKTGFWGTGYYR